MTADTYTISSADMSATTWELKLYEVAQ
jgi:hypothetical protein